MITSRLVRDKKGIDAVVSSLILLAVTVAAMVLAIGLSQAIIDNRRSQMGERLQVEKILIDANKIDVYLRNTGHVTIVLKYIMINGTFYPLTPNCWLQPLEGSPEGQWAKITVTNSYGEGLFRFSFFSSNNVELGRTEVEYDETKL